MLPDQPKKLFSALVLGLAVAAGAIGAEFKAGIEYGEAGGESLRLDASIPGGPGPFPMVIIVHGGGWSSGDKQRDITPLFDPLTRANFTWFSINYRLAPSNRWPACLEDVQTAVRWVKSHASDFKGDTQRVALIGYSAGGQLACQTVMLASPDTLVQAVVGIAPPTDLVAETAQRGGLGQSLKNLLGREIVDNEVKAELHEMSPINHVVPGLPPFLLIHGTADKLYPQSLSFQARLRRNGVRCDLITITNAPHSIMAWEKMDTSYKEQMTAWLKRTLVTEKQTKGTITDR